MSAFMRAQVSGSWESPSADNKRCERGEKESAARSFQSMDHVSERPACQAPTETRSNHQEGMDERQTEDRGVISEKFGWRDEYKDGHRLRLLKS